MNKTFKIKFVWDTGWSYLDETAIVIAENKESAERNLRNYIGGLRSDSCVKEIKSVIETDDNVFVIKKLC